MSEENKHEEVVVRLRKVWSAFVGRGTIKAGIVGSHESDDGEKVELLIGDLRFSRATWDDMKRSSLTNVEKPEPQYAETIDAEKIERMLAAKDKAMACLKDMLDKAQARACGLTDVLGERDRTIEGYKEELRQEKIARLSAESAQRKAKR